MKSILIIGNFGDINKLNGQTMRTRTIWSSVCKKYAGRFSIEIIDTSRRTLSFATLSVYRILLAYRIIILPARGSIKALLFLIHYLGASEKTVHVAIGGWLPEFLSGHKWTKYENRLKAVLVQMESLKRRLEEKGYTNVRYFPNYREDTEEKVRVSGKNVFPEKLVFYARIIPEKGIMEAVEAVKRLHIRYQGTTMDIYGPLESDFKEEFFNKIKLLNFVHYKRPLVPGEVLTILQEYDLLLFPTHYDGEGFPGTILEAFMAGLPVIASRWKYNAEIVEENITGLLCEPYSADSIVACVEKLYNARELFSQMPANCIEQSKKFSEKNVTRILFDSLGIDD